VNIYSLGGKEEEGQRGKKTLAPENVFRPETRGEVGAGVWGGGGGVWGGGGGGGGGGFLLLPLQKKKGKTCSQNAVTIISKKGSIPSPLLAKKKGSSRALS